MRVTQLLTGVVSLSCLQLAVRWPEPTRTAWRLTSNKTTRQLYGSFNL